MKTSQAVQIYEILSGLSNQKFSGKVAFKLLQNMRKLSSIVTDYYTAQQAILDAHGEEIAERPGMFRAKAGHEEQFKQESQDLMNMEVGIQLMKISIDDLGDIQISMNDLDGLKPILDGVE